MKKIVLTLAIALMALVTFAQGIKFEHTAWNDVLKKAKQQKKIVFVCFSTSW